MSDKPIVDELEILPVEDSPKQRRQLPTRPTATKAKKTAPPYKEGALVEPLSKMYAALALGIMPLAPRTATAIMSETEDGSTVAESCARAWDEWAKTSPAVRRLLYPLLNVSGGAKVVAAHLPILLAVGIESGIVSRFLGNPTFADQVEQFLKSGAQE